MALDTHLVFPQDLFAYTMKDLCSLGGGVWGYNFGHEEEKKDGGQEGMNGLQLDGDDQHPNWDSYFTSLVHNFEEWDVTSSSPEAAAMAAAAGRSKRRRTKKCKNLEEVENQRKTHIAVERNRRKQMNEYLGLLRSLMPPSYLQRGDQASIVGGAINFVKELEQLLQSLEAQKRIKQQPETTDGSSSSSSTFPFADFFTFPQYSSSSLSSSTAAATITDNNTNEMTGENSTAVADIEVTMAESHANLKVLVGRQPKQLLKMVVGLQNLQLTTLHLNVTTVDQMVLYSFSLKVEEGCQFTSVDDIAAAVHQLVGKIQDEAALN